MHWCSTIHGELLKHENFASYFHSFNESLKMLPENQNQAYRVSTFIVILWSAWNLQNFCDQKFSHVLYTVYIASTYLSCHNEAEGTNNIINHQLDILELLRILLVANDLWKCFLTKESITSHSAFTLIVV